MVNSLLSEIIYKSSQKKLLTFVRNELLFREGEKANGVYIIISGRVKITKQSKSNTRIILHIANAGETLAIHAVINHHNHTNSAIAITKTSAYLIPADEFLHIIKKNTGYKFSIMKMLCSNINLIENKFNIRNEKTVGERLADTLISLARTYGIDKQGYINLALPLGDFAELIGTSKEYISRLVHGFSKSGLISADLGRIKILDLSRLETLAGLEKSVLS